MIEAARLTEILGAPVHRVDRCGGGAAGTVWRVHLRDGATVIAKQARGLDVEARSLSVLAERSRLTVPRVIRAEPDLLVMADLGDSGQIDAHAEHHAAELLADLHDRLAPDGRFGLDFDNLIGPLDQPNTPTASWVEFFRERRLLAMAEAAGAEGVLPRSLHARTRTLADRLGELIPDRPPAALIHGDVWGGNVIARDGSIAGFIDPAPYHAHAEMELAFITMFGTFGRGFFDHYSRLRPIEPGFFETRRSVYLLYPILTHIRIYRGGGYVQQFDRTLSELGF